MINEDALYERIGARLRAIRTSPSMRRLTQERLADLVGLERTSITNIESGKQKVPLHVLYEICCALQVDISEVLPSTSDIATKSEDERLTVGKQVHQVTPQIADIFRRLK